MPTHPDSPFGLPLPKNFQVNNPRFRAAADFECCFITLGMLSASHYAPPSSCYNHVIDLDRLPSQGGLVGATSGRVTISGPNSFPNKLTGLPVRAR